MKNDRKLDVLIIDDEVTFTEVLSKRLSKRGINVRIANDGQTGVNEFSKHGADVIVLDIRMPEMDGVQTFKAIKALDPDVQVIFLTGHVDTDTAMEGLDLGAFDYCLKPIDIDSLYDKLMDATEHKKLNGD